MEIKKAATAGTLESSDCMVTVEPGEGKIDFSLESSVIHQYGNQLRKVALDTLKDLDIDNIRITIVDKGALDCTLKARIEGAVFRSVDQYENMAITYLGSGSISLTIASPSVISEAMLPSKSSSAILRWLSR